MERKKVQKETNDFLEVMQLPKPTTQEEWRAVWKEVGTLLAAKHFISHTPVPVMLQMWWTPRSISVSGPCVMSGSLFLLRSFVVFPMFTPNWNPMKVAWRCNTEQWWWAEVPPSQAGMPLTLIRPPSTL